MSVQQTDMKGNLCLVNVMLPQLLKKAATSGHEPFFLGVYQRQSDFGTDVEIRGRTVTVLMAGDA